MSQRITGLYRLTQVPAVYAAFQNLLGGPRTRAALIADYLRPAPGMRVLDIGCGSASLLPDLGPVAYTGIDLNPEHIAAAKARFGTSATFLCGSVAGLGALAQGPFDLVMGIGVLHHLDDPEVDALARDVAARLAPGGRFVTVDPAFTPGQNPVARWLAARDSGQSVRTPEGYAERLRPQFRDVAAAVRHDLLRVPYTHCILTASA